MDFFINWLLIVLLMLAAAAAPGPDFVLAVRNSLRYSRKTGILTAIGFGLGVCVHVSYCILGIAALISHSIMIFNLIKYLGAGYLVYIGWQALHSHGFAGATDSDNIKKASDISPLKALGSGFVTNLLNPKATMFFFALFTQVIDPHTPLMVQVFYGATMASIVILWFSVVATILTHKEVKARFLRFSKWIDRICGGLMIALGLKLALAKAAS